MSTIQPWIFYTYMTQCMQLSAIKTAAARKILMLFISVIRCMWNIRVAYVVLALYSVLLMKVLCGMTMASNAWRHK